MVPTKHRLGGPVAAAQDLDAGRIIQVREWLGRNMAIWQ